MNTTFVTAYINIYGTNHYEKKDATWRFSQFVKLAKTGVLLVVFCDHENYDALSDLVLQYDNIRLMPAIELADMAFHRIFCETFPDPGPDKDLVLPVHRNVPKDTAEYILLQHSKVEFVQRVRQQNPWATSNFAWIDFNVFHVFQHDEHVRTILDMIARSPASPYLTFPGCKSAPIPAGEFDRLHYFDNICWRFCGGFFWGSAAAIDEFAVMSIENFAPYLRKFDKMPWEVNYWAYLEAVFPAWKHTIYMSDHNERLLAVPPHLLTRFLTQTPHRSVPYECPTDYPYISSSTSYLCVGGRHYANIRCVNYELSERGYYWIRHPEGHIYTENYLAEVDLVRGPRTYVRVEADVQIPDRGGKIYGLEDIRLYPGTPAGSTPNEGTEVKFVATSANYSPTERSRIVCGHYDLETAHIHSCRVIEPPENTWCEKNWIPLGNDEFVYKWYPYQIGHLDGDRLSIVRQYDLGQFPFCDRLRGSTIFQPVPYGFLEGSLDRDGGGSLGVVHFSIDTEPRQYYHMMILLDKENVPVRHSGIFSFRKTSIEFCIGFAMDGDAVCFFVSNFDRDSEMIRIPATALPELKYEIRAKRDK
jgi:hypothetical protein